MKELIDIFFTSARVGAMTFGGGYAMLPILQKEVVEKKKWNTEEEILDYYALSTVPSGNHHGKDAEHSSDRKRKARQGLLPVH